MRLCTRGVKEKSKRGKKRRNEVTAEETRESEGKGDEGKEERKSAGIGEGGVPRVCERQPQRARGLRATSPPRRKGVSSYSPPVKCTESDGERPTRSPTYPTCVQDSNIVIFCSPSHLPRRQYEKC